MSLPTSRSLRFVLAATVLAGHALAETPAPAGVKPIPAPGIQIKDGDRAELEAGVIALGKDITVLRHNLQSKPELLALLPDVMIFHKAVDWSLRYNEFFNAKQVATAKTLLELGNQRASELKAGKASWNTATGLVPRGYISRIDGSVQPYGMVIPDDWKADEKTPRRLDFWCHGRGESLTELSFIDQRLTIKGEFTPPGAFVLHLYGRFCCANKFAGEVDLFEALSNAATHYPIDHNKVVIRGFSMGGGSAWQFGTHFGGLWAAVQPGAGFGESKEFLKLGTAPDKPLPPAWEQTLWQWYDSTGYVANLSNTTTVAYSGEIDPQKQAADIMIRYAEKEGVKIQHIIGPQTQHKLKPETKPEIEAAVDAGVAKHEAYPKKVRFTTYTLIYHSMDWVRIAGMEKEWERADVTAEHKAPGSFEATTKNVSALQFLLPPDEKGQPLHDIQIDGQSLLTGTAPSTPAEGSLSFLKVDGKWRYITDVKQIAQLRPEPNKRAGVCGPIDHAFMSSFLFVRPTGKPLNDKVGAWATGELDHAIGFWRKVFRGEAPVKDDSALNEDDLKNSNLILWGDPSSNKVLAQIITKLPLQWSATQLTFGGQTYDAAHTAPVLIFPNPLNPNKYVVINSGVTFREQALLNNADQTPKLPDWAIIDLNTPPDAKWPGEVKAAGFFDEQWKLPAK